MTAALAVLTKMTKGVTSSAPLMEFSLVSANLGDASAYHEDLIRKYGLLYMAPDRTRFERMMNPPAIPSRCFCRILLSRIRSSSLPILRDTPRCSTVGM